MGKDGKEVKKLDTGKTYYNCCCCFYCLPCRVLCSCCSFCCHCMVYTTLFALILLVCGTVYARRSQTCCGSSSTTSCLLQASFHNVTSYMQFVQHWKLKGHPSSHRLHAATLICNEAYRAVPASPTCYLNYLRCVNRSLSERQANML